MNEDSALLLAAETVRIEEQNVRLVIRNCLPFRFAPADLSVTCGRLILLPKKYYRSPIFIPLTSISSLEVCEIAQGEKKPPVLQAELLCRSLLSVLILFADVASGRQVLHVLSNHASFSKNFPFEHAAALAERPAR